MKLERSLLRDAGLVLLALVTVVAAAYVLTRTPGEPEPAASDVAVPAVPASPSPEASAAPVRALLIGTGDDAPLARALQEELGWQVTQRLVPASGFIAGPPGGSFIDRVPALVRDLPADVVVLSAGTAEGEGADLRRYGANVAFVLSAVREALPEARVVLVGPVAAREFSGTRGQLTGVAARWGAFYVDPIGRYLEAEPALLEPDGTLGARGRAAVTQLITEDLARVLPADLVPEDVNGG